MLNGRNGLPGILKNLSATTRRTAEEDDFL
jgi:hypothetical protein